MAKVKAGTVALRVPPGDYTNLKNKSEVMHHISEDISELMSEIKGADMFYLTMKTYFTDRKNLHKLIDNDLKKACVHSVIISVMTRQASVMHNEKASQKEIVEMVKDTHKLVKRMRALLNSEILLEGWDNFCSEVGEVRAEPADEAIFDDMSLKKFNTKRNKNKSNNSEIEIDNHLDTKA